MLKYVVVDETVRTKFEKEHQIPFGYATCPISDSFERAICLLDDQAAFLRNIGSEYRNLVIEEWATGKKHIVYRYGD